MAKDTGEAKLLAAAKAGKIDRIIELSGVEEDDDEGDGESEITAYKWLLVAGDFGHDVEDDLDAIHTGTSLHHDDDQAVVGSIHFELGEAYLRGLDGLAVDHELAKEHLDQAKELRVDQSLDLAKELERIRKKLGAEALAIFNSAFPPKKTKAKPKAKR